MKRPRAEHSVSGKTVSLKTLVQIQRKELEKDHVASRMVVKNKVFTPSQLNTLEKNGVLTPVTYRGTKYFRRDELRQALSKV